MAAQGDRPLHLGHLLHLHHGLRGRRRAHPVRRRGAARPARAADGRRRAISTPARWRTTFNLMRANDLIWSFVVSNYLLGKEPVPFDLLYWNSDSTRMPAATHRYYLRNMYQKNLLKEPGGLTLKGTPIDLRQVDDAGVPALGARGPHRALAEHLRRGRTSTPGRCASCWRARATSPGVINPAGSTKYGYCTNEELPADRRRLARRGHAAPGLVVAGLGRVARPVRRRQGQGARPGQGRPAGARGRARQLRQGRVLSERTARIAPQSTGQSGGKEHGPG